MRHKLMLLAGALLIAIPATLFCLPADGVTPVNNRDYVSSVHKLIGEAKSRIRVMTYQAWYYEDYPNSDSNRFLEELIKAKKRGVDVLVFLETSNWDQNLEGRNRDYAKRLEKGGVTVYFDHSEITSHEKVLIVDDYATLVASNNWSHFSLWMNNEVGVIVWSEEVAGGFNGYLNELLEQAGEKAIPPSPVRDRIEPCDFKLFPAEDVQLLTNRKYFPILRKAFQNAKKSIRVIQRSANYYTMFPSYAKKGERKPGEPISHTNVLLRELIEAKKRGIDVQVVLDAEVRKRKSTGQWRVNNQNEDFAMRLMAGNVPVFYDSLTTQTHTKMALVDDMSIIGSTNWTFNALHQGNEASVLIKSPQLAAIYQEYFDEVKKPGLEAKPGFDLFSLKQEMEKRDKKTRGDMLN